MAKRTARVHGLRACLALFRARPDDIRRAWVTEQTIPEVREVLRVLARRRKPYKVVDAEELSRVCGVVHHEGICLEALEPRPPSLDALVQPLRDSERSARLVFLDGVANPHNVGAIARTCAHFGAAAIVGIEGELAALRGAAYRIAEGGAEHVPVVTAPEAEPAFATLAAAGIVPIATGGDGGEDLFTAQLPARCVFLLGAERQGLTERTRRLAQRTVTIPGTGAVESLNVSAACAVLLAEHSRRHGL